MCLNILKEGCGNAVCDPAEGGIERRGAVVKEPACCSACARVVSDCRQRSVSPLGPWCSTHHSFMDASTSSLQWMAISGPCVDANRLASSRLTENLGRYT